MPAHDSPTSGTKTHAVCAIGRVASLAVLLAVSCGSKGAVSVTANISSPRLSVDSSALAANLSGEFTLNLALGQHASSGSDVSITNFAVVDPANQSTLALLKFVTNPAAPYHLEPGEKLDVRLAIADKPGSLGQVLTKEEEAAVCAARAAVQIAGAITDNGGLVSINSGTFPATCFNSAPVGASGREDAVK